MLPARSLGALHLDELPRRPDLDAFVLFSSIAGVWGSGGRATTPPATPTSTPSPTTGAPGACRHRHRLGPVGRRRHGRRRAWPPTSLRRRACRRWTRTGARRACDRRCDRRHHRRDVADVDWAALRPAVHRRPRPSPLLDDLPEVRALRAHEAAAATAAGARRALRRARRPARGRAAARLLDLVRDAGRRRPRPRRPRRRRAGPAVPGPRLRLADRRRAAQPAGAATGLRLPATLVFDHPTPAGLAAHLRRAASARPAPRPTRRRRHRRHADEPDRDRRHGLPLPRRRRLPEDLWQLRRRRRRDAIGRFPADRGWDLDALYDPDPDQPGTSYTRDGGFLARRRRASTRRSSASRPREALAMDPQQRLLLETVLGGVRAGRDRPGDAARQPRPASSSARPPPDYGTG